MATNAEILARAKVLGDEIYTRELELDRIVSPLCIEVMAGDDDAAAQCLIEALPREASIHRLELQIWLHKRKVKA